MDESCASNVVDGHAGHERASCAADELETREWRVGAAAGERCGPFLSRIVRNVQATDVQADEIWGYVQKKEGHKKFKTEE